jgi:hypothetical protein
VAKSGPCASAVESIGTAFSVTNKGTMITSLAVRLAMDSLVALLLLKKSPDMSDDVEVDWAASSKPP